MFSPIFTVIFELQIDNLIRGTWRCCCSRLLFPSLSAISLWLSSCKCAPFSNNLRIICHWWQKRVTDYYQSVYIHKNWHLDRTMPNHDACIFVSITGYGSWFSKNDSWDCQTLTMFCTIVQVYVLTALAYKKRGLSEKTTTQGVSG